ncbi:MAG: thiamine diphosphokinase [Candidatus Kapaibacteriota bacterium]
MKVLSFQSQKPDCILFLQGMKPDVELCSFFPDTRIIATDGAASDLLAIGITPHFVIGDMDSFDPATVSDDVCKVIIDENQENNDFEKALSFALERNMSHVLIWGIHGGDFEHSLNNTSVLWKYVGQFSQLTIVDSMQRFAVPVFFDMICNEVNPDEIISLIPFPHARLSTNGLKWELEEEVLELSIREGARNRAISSSLSIKLHEGRLLFFCDTRFPNIPIFT